MRKQTENLDHPSPLRGSAVEFTEEHLRLLIETHTIVKQLRDYLLDNGQPGEISKIKTRLTWLESVAYTSTGAAVLLGFLVKLGLLKVVP